MMNNDERQKVAKRLRGLRGYEADGKKLCSCYDVLDALGIENRIVCSRTGVDRLADLIDPTCHVVGTISQDWSNGPTVYVHGLSCGHASHTSMPEPPAYCDECGARVVDECHSQNTCS